MKVYGYTDEKDVVQVDLPIDTIVDAGLDPWRLDLFDPSPVTLVDGDGLLYRQVLAQLIESNRAALKGFQGRLYFRKLQDVSFAYRRDDLRLFLGLHDGSRATCVWGQQDEDSEGKISILKISESESPFIEHFREYLKLMEKLSPDRFPPRPSREQLLKQRILKPQPAEAATLKGDTLTFHAVEVSELDAAFDALLQLQPLTFEGAMFDALDIPAQLPEQINWVLEALSKWVPEVAGDAVRLALSGEPVTEVILNLNGLDWTVVRVIRQFLAENFGIECGNSSVQYSVLPPYELDFVFQDCRYLVTNERGVNAALVRSPSPYDYSVEAAYSDKENEVNITRIGLFDFGKRQARRLFPHDAKARRSVQRAKLKSEGFKILDPH